MKKKRGKMCILLRVSLIIMFLSLPAISFAGSRKVTLDLHSVTVKDFFDALHKQTGLSFIYNVEQIKLLNAVTIKVSNKTVDDVLKKVFKGTNLLYTFSDNMVIISQYKAGNRIISGIIYDNYGKVLPGAVVRVFDANGKELRNICVTTDNGHYSVEVPSNINCVLSVSFVGMKVKQSNIKVDNENIIRNISMSSDNVLNDVVVTGIYTRKAESFTGASTTISSDELTRVSNQNIIQSLKILDPTIYIPDNMTMGSDPNTTPTISMRGTSSFPVEGTTTLKGNYQNQPNQPLFILDGFETTLQTVMDMDMNRVESITILKDASAKALYGSKAANGVIVIETKKLTGNKQRITYNGNISFEVPDLTSYNMCNATEKLQAEVAEGVYTDSDVDTQASLTKLYNNRRKLVLEGLDTYWLSKPLHSGVGYKHDLNIELGDSNGLRAILDLTYDKVSGAMKESDRTNISGDVNVSYRQKNLLFKNILSIVSNNSQDSPYGSFSDYVKMNPYWQATDENGKVLRWAEDNIANPMYDSQIGTSLKSNYLQFINNFYTEWQFYQDFKATFRFGVSQKRNGVDDFYPRDHSMFASYTSDEDLLRRGKYIAEDGKSSSISSDLNINFNKEIGLHTIFANVGTFISEDKSSAYQYTAEGFTNNQNTDITFARQYAEGTTPIGFSSINRQASFLTALSYDYANRYLMDATLRESASSLYGKDNRWANSWSLGLGWNMHNEKFMRNLKFVKQLKFRASVGLTGNQNFDTNAAIGTYKYYTGVVYGGFTGAYLNNMPNSGLKWEQKKDYDIGVDLRISGLSLSADYYRADTKNMLTDVTIPTSTGFSTVKDNLGLVRNSGYELKANYNILHGKYGFVNVYGALTYTKNKIISLSESMKAYNEKMEKSAESTSNSIPVLMYKDGQSMNTIWAVPSAGIDPQTGMEIYIKKDGSYTYTYDASDLVAAGNSLPKYRGTAGISAEYKGIGFNTTLSFLTGCQMYNYTLVDRVEDVDITYNVDKRVLYGRWQKPGDVTKYKKFQSKEVTRATTRFVQNRHELDLSSISFYYEMPASIYKKMYMQRLKLAFYMNDVATFSSIRIERGTSYPFARNFSFSLTSTF
jgi:TonB-linked SusC/RagA family outer membrane protein